MSAKQGFENKLARILAEELNADVQYVWRVQRRGFFRETLGQGRCDLVMGVPTDSRECATSKPYYRSTYVFVSRKADKLDIQSFDDAELRDLKIGAQLLGDGNIIPPAEALAKRGMQDNVVGYSLFADYSAANPTSRIMRAVADGEIDIAIAWGPFAGYFSQEQSPELAIRPVPESEDPQIPHSFDISVGVRKGDDALLREVNGALKERRDDIKQLLETFRVPDCSHGNAISQAEEKP